MPEWGTIAIWLGWAATVGGFVFAMGKQAQRIENHQERIEALEQEQESNREIPIKLATLETDIKYLVQGMSEIKSLLIKDLTGGN